MPTASTRSDLVGTSAPPEAAAGACPVKVWDLPTRLFHWLLVGAVLFALATGLLAPKWWLGRHVVAGYVVAGLLLFRFVWAVHGSEFSRFASFAYRPRQVLAHLGSLLRLRAGHYLGHNPSGAAMIFALLGILSLLVVTGFIQQGGFEKQGPFAGLVSYAVGSQARQIHKLAAYLLLLLIAAHLSGVLLGSFFFKEPLIPAMIHGRKLVSPGLAGRGSWRRARPALAALWLALLATPTVGALVVLSGLPPLGLPAMPPSPAMLGECGACHHPFHPSLLPAASWARLMASLSDHFGEDASLPPAKRDEIAGYLEGYAAEAWDSKPAHRFAVVAPNNPISITATPGWQRIHRRLDPALFRAPVVKARSNCVACHRDADGGRFDPQEIAIPQ
jgi:cytochrome b